MREERERERVVEEVKKKTIHYKNNNFNTVIRKTKAK